MYEFTNLKTPFKCHCVDSVGSRVVTIDTACNSADGITVRNGANNPCITMPLGICACYQRDLENCIDNFDYVSVALLGRVWAEAGDKVRARKALTFDIFGRVIEQEGTSAKYVVGYSDGCASAAGTLITVFVDRMLA